MKCELCNSNEVNRAIKKIADGVEQDFFVCNQCAMEESSGFSGDFAASLSHGLKNEMVPNVNVFMDATINISAGPGGAAGKRCPTCGFIVTKNASYKNLGCPDCYKTFEKEILKRKLADGYSGKRPPEADPKIEIVALKSQIEDAVRESRFNDVFRLKLQLEDAESRGKGLGRPEGD
jgi:protein arginine kinase activator